jgi:hypothetical protein
MGRMVWWESAAAPKLIGSYSGSVVKRAAGRRSGGISNARGDLAIPHSLLY